MPQKRENGLSGRRSYRRYALAAAGLALLLLALPVGLCAGGRAIEVTYIYSPLCGLCEHAGPAIRAAVDDSRATGADIRYAEYSYRSAEGGALMERYGLATVPAVVVDGKAIRPEDFDGDTKKLEGLIKQAIAGAAHDQATVTLERKISSIPEKDTVKVVTCISNAGGEPVYAMLDGGTCEGVRVIAGEPEWEGRIAGGKRRYLAYEADIARGVRSLPPQTLTYTDALGGHRVTGPETPVFILKKLSMTAVFLAGVVAGFNPCLLAILAFVSAMALSLKGRRIDIVVSLFAFSSGLLCIYLLMGIGFLRLIESSPAIASTLETAIVGLLVVLAAFAFYEAYRIKKNADKGSFFKGVVDKYKPLYRKYSLPASFGLGGAFGLIKMPCVGGIYVGILGAIASSDEAARGLFYLAAYNLGVVLPVLAVGMLLALGLRPEKVDRLRKKHRFEMKLATGVILAGMAAGFLLNVL